MNIYEQICKAYALIIKQGLNADWVEASQEKFDELLACKNADVEREGDGASLYILDKRLTVFVGDKKFLKYVNSDFVFSKCIETKINFSELQKEGKVEESHSINTEGELVTESLSAKVVLGDSGKNFVVGFLDGTIREINMQNWLECRRSK